MSRRVVTVAFGAVAVGFGAFACQNYEFHHLNAAVERGQGQSLEITALGKAQ